MLRANHQPEGCELTLKPACKPTTLGAISAYQRVYWFYTGLDIGFQVGVSTHSGLGFRDCFGKTFTFLVRSTFLLRFMFQG